MLWEDHYFFLWEIVSLSFFLSFFLSFYFILFFFFWGEGGTSVQVIKSAVTSGMKWSIASKTKIQKKCLYVHYTDWSPQWVSMPIVTRKFTDFPVCVIRYIFIRKLSHLTISSSFILKNKKMHKNHNGF